MFQTEAHQLQTVVALFQKQAGNVDTTLQAFIRCLDAVKRSGWHGPEAESFANEMEHVILPQLHEFKQALNNVHREWAGTLDRLLQVEPLLDSFMQRMAQVSVAAEKIATSHQALMDQLAAKMATLTEEGEAADDSVSD